MSIFWGDLHTHCGITYGYGSLENALNAAEKQLDFCAIIGHAMWPDIPEYRGEYEYLESMVSYHNQGFEKLEENWEYIRETVNQAHHPEEFVTFQGYEMHSCQHGDHHFISPDGDLPLIKADSPYDLVEKLSPHRVIAILHHPGYAPGYRGANWDTFSSEISPVVEVYSKHGAAVSDQSRYNYLHSMGPRDSRSTIFSGLRQNNRFGFVASTDHHAGYPGSYGDGRMAVFAEEKTRKSIWEAILNRETYAVTGDKIKCNFKINNSDMGSVVEAPSSRKINLEVEACDFIDKIVVYKNLKPWKIINGEFIDSSSDENKYKVRVEMGWGHDDKPYLWQGDINIEGGKLKSVDPCFRGKNVLAPDSKLKNTENINKLNNNIKEKSKKKVSWQCTTFKNPSTRYSQTNSLLLEIEGDENTRLKVNINGKSKSYMISKLLKGSLSTHIERYNSEAFVVHKAVPFSKFNYQEVWEDKEPENPEDIYQVEVSQKNNQMAWLSPIFVEKV